MSSHPGISRLFAERLEALHFDGTGCGTSGANACSNCCGPSPMTASDIGDEVAVLLAKLGPLPETFQQSDERFIKYSMEYRSVARRYEGRTAERSGIPYVQHIDEGLWVLDQIGASMTARLAYCLHPLCQADADLLTFDPNLASNPEVLTAVMEYRNAANAYLPHHWKDPNRRARLSPSAVVNEMLVADKVQNRKDFEDHHQASHPNSTGLGMYFAEWLHVLGISNEQYRSLVTGLQERSRP